ncbi:TSUP family transporter [Hydrogenophaga sp. YM1]|jgi:hypothetical protein|uniref:Probable membrane transporter protein n=1 Tax=Hydrogenophaga borbori TaxID=2294117 RepID=A0A372EJ05_9BURK|nr:MULTISPECIES: TSUP family transporter [Hydrogenophaga]NCT99403.1 TSUP family transporter [Comamonadaceae bacterium]ODT33284.1 MAG: hypothetical protein ABS53_05450 [Hydrogenophaga sp. SCN 70-13]MBN9370236.1 TSUP family transporter [Hydrogenophaga sp.]OJV72165.1 MAG: hypothetical protein BGO22_21795 [Hydrogenophaga sp. 70-12]QRR34545.1 TSUP family transporter [Hydrogenophaga sp. YM1]
MELLLVSAASLLAGFVDSIVGGGGLILVPAMFAVFPHTHPATLFGINKGAAVLGTAAATVQYARRVDMPWRALLPAAAMAFAGAMAGAWTVTVVSPDFLRRALPFVLGAVLLYTLARKDLGHAHDPAFAGRRLTAAACLMGAVIGFYDGFFGPGTGSFFVFLFVRWLGFDFLHASASAKLLNTASNLAALLLFALKGHVWWHYALVMALANVVGSLAGTRLALKHGSGFVRWVFIGVVGALILKTTWDAWLR